MKFVLVGLLGVMGALAASESIDSLREHLPAGVTPLAEERAAVLSWAAVVKECQVLYDTAGHVVRVSVKGAQPGIDGTLFTQVRAWPRLHSLHLRHQRPTKAALATLNDLPHFEGLCLMNIGKDPQTEKNSLEADYIRDLFLLAGRLRNLDLVHTFGYRLATPPFAEWPELPALERLVLEGGGAEHLELFAKTPNLRVLGWHRTRMGAEDWAQVPELLPQLRVLMVKPGKGPAPTFLAHLKNFQQLETIAFHHWPPAKIGWEGGLEHLAAMPQLQRVVFGGSTGDDWSAIERLVEARPDLAVIRRGNFGPPVAGADGRPLYSPRDVDAWTQPNAIVDGTESP